MMMPYRHVNSRGFTLIELMIVVGLIGILAAMALVSYRSYQCKVKQSEAKTHLGTIRTNEEAYYVEYDAYSSSTSRIGFASKGESRYDYSISTASDSFTATATGRSNTGITGDTWTIDDAGNLFNTASACS